MSIPESPQYERVHSVVTTDPVLPSFLPSCRPTHGDSEVPGRRRQRARALADVVHRALLPDALIAAATGLFLLTVGLIAITRGGFHGTSNCPSSTYSASPIGRSSA